MTPHDSLQFQNYTKELVSFLVRNTKLKYFGANLPFTNDYSILHLKRQLAVILQEVNNYMLNIDYWKMIADILVDHNPKEFYWFVAQMTREYTTAMLPVLTAEYPTRKVCPYMLIDLATVLDVNLIIYDLGFPLQYKRATAVPLLVILDFQTIMLFSSLIIPSMLQVTESNSIVGVIFCYKKSD